MGDVARGCLPAKGRAAGDRACGPGRTHSPQTAVRPPCGIVRAAEKTRWPCAVAGEFRTTRDREPALRRSRGDHRVASWASGGPHAVVQKDLFQLFYVLVLFFLPSLNNFPEINLTKRRSRSSVHPLFCPPARTQEGARTQVNRKQL